MILNGIQFKWLAMHWPFHDLSCFFTSYFMTKRTLADRNYAACQKTGLKKAG
jgi:hypothetical protein